MFDADYFTTRLPRDTSAIGGEPIVEVSLINGHTHRLRSVVDVTAGYVVLEAYQLKGDLAHQRPRFVESGTPVAEGEAVFRVTAAYESIAAVVIDPTVTAVRARPGFA